MASAGKNWEFRSIRSTPKILMTFLVIKTSSILFSLTKMTLFVLLSYVAECHEWKHANFNVAHVIF